MKSKLSHSRFLHGWDWRDSNTSRCLINILTSLTLGWLFLRYLGLWCIENTGYVKNQMVFYWLRKFNILTFMISASFIKVITHYLITMVGLQKKYRDILWFLNIISQLWLGPLHFSHFDQGVRPRWDCTWWLQFLVTKASLLLLVFSLFIDISLRHLLRYSWHSVCDMTMRTCSHINHFQTYDFAIEQSLWIRGNYHLFPPPKKKIQLKFQHQ